MNEYNSISHKNTLPTSKVSSHRSNPILTALNDVRNHNRGVLRHDSRGRWSPYSWPSVILQGTLCFKFLVTETAPFKDSSTFRKPTTEGAKYFHEFEHFPDHPYKVVRLEPPSNVIIAKLNTIPFARDSKPGYKGAATDQFDPVCSSEGAWWNWQTRRT